MEHKNGSRLKRTISGFSKLPKGKKIDWVTGQFFPDSREAAEELKSYWREDEDQRVFDGFSENTLSNFIMPYSVAPNFLINGRTYCVPMVIEESSVVAAAASAAKFWLPRGGFRAEVLDMKKVGQLHFLWKGTPARLQVLMPPLRETLLREVSDITSNMQKRGGGISQIELRDFSAEEPHYYQLLVTFDTCDSMGANFINSVLEQFAETLRSFFAQSPLLQEDEREFEVVMAILSNYTPECLVRAWVECPIEELGEFAGCMEPAAFAERFRRAIRIAEIDPYRATTHNKGIFNGVDSVVIATANDFRAVESCGHTYASRDGQYRSLSHCSLDDGIFRFWLDLPLAVGTVGGLTRLHPLARRSLELLGNPSAEELMQIIACTGLAQNFGAVRSLVTTGIQYGHMKMHLTNILNHLGADERETKLVQNHFQNQVVSFNSVRSFLEQCRKEASQGPNTK